jgi:hypothetical protein
MLDPLLCFSAAGCGGASERAVLGFGGCGGAVNLLPRGVERVGADRA